MKPADEELELSRLLAAEADGRKSDVALLRGRGPDATELASLASRLALQGVDVTPPSGSPVQAQPWKKWALGGASGVSAVLLWLALRAPQPIPESAPAVAQPPELAKAAASQAAPEASSSPRPGSPARAANPTSLGQPAPNGAAASIEAPAPIAASPAAAAPTSPGSSPTASPATPPDSQRRVSSGAAPATPSSGRSEPMPDQAAAPTEIELLRDARFALKQSPARALELTDQHARLYPAGKLMQERELIAITALVSLGRRTAALSRGASFERAFPRSAYLAQLNELLR